MLNIFSSPPQTISYEGIRREANNVIVSYIFEKNFEYSDLENQDLLSSGNLIHHLHILPIVISLYGWERDLVFIRFLDTVFLASKQEEKVYVFRGGVQIDEQTINLHGTVQV